MTEDERDYGALVASIIEPTPHTDGLAALRRLFDRWAYETHKPGADVQQVRDIATMRRRTNP